MLQSFVITLREGLESFLIVAIILAYLRKGGQARLVRAVHLGIGASLILSVAAGLLLAQASNQALWEGILAVVAAITVASFTIHMRSEERRVGKECRSRVSPDQVEK